MTSPDFIESKLASRTNARRWDRKVKNNRYHYQLFFDEMIGFDWIERQIEKASAEVEPTLELYEFGPAASFLLVEVREVERREGIDDSQKGLREFEP